VWVAIVQSYTAELGIVMQLVGSAVELLGDQREVAHASVLLVHDQSGVLEHGELLDDRWQRYVERFRELGHRRGAIGEAFGDRAARRVRQRGEHGIEAVS